MPFNPPNFMNPNPGRMRNPFGNIFQPPQEDLASQAIRRNRIPTPMMQQGPEELPGLQSPQLDAYSEYLKTMPQRGNNTLMQKIIAALGGASAGYKGGAGAGMETAQQYLDLPYRKSMEEWMIKGQGMKDAATLENRNMAQENANMKNRLTYDVGMGRNQIGMDANDVKRQQIAAKIDETEMEIAGALERAGIARETAIEQARIRANAMRESAGIRANAALGAAQIGASSRENVAGIDATSRENVAQTLANSRENVAGMKTVQPNSAFESLEDQRDLQELATRYPNAIGQASNGKFYPVAPGASGFFSSNADEQAEYDRLTAELNQKRAGRTGSRTPVAPAAPRRPRNQPQKRTITLPDGTVVEVG